MTHEEFLQKALSEAVTSPLKTIIEAGITITPSYDGSKQSTLHVFKTGDRSVTLVVRDSDYGTPEAVLHRAFIEIAERLKQPEHYSALLLRDIQ